MLEIATADLPKNESILDCLRKDRTVQCTVRFFMRMTFIIIEVHNFAVYNVFAVSSQSYYSRGRVTEDALYTYTYMYIVGCMYV